jgi:hypothetical protein
VTETQRPLALSATVAAAPRIRLVADAAQWNALLFALGDPDLRQGFEWGALRRRGVARTLRYAVYDGDAPAAAMAVGVWRGVGAPWSALYVSRGPVLGPPCERAWTSLVEAAVDLARRTRAVFLRCSPAAASDGGVDDTHTALLRAGFVHLPDECTVWNAPRVTMALDLRPSEAALTRAMRESTRLSLTRVQKHGGRVDVDASEQAVTRLHRLLADAGRRKGYPVREPAFFQALRRHYLARDQGCIALASDGGGDLAGVLGVRFARRAYLLYAGVAEREAARKLRAGVAAHWSLIRWAKAAGCETLDWGGAVTSFPPHPESFGYGIYDFKRGFGCSLVRLPGYYDLVFRPVAYRVFRWMETRCAPALWRFRARLNGRV